MNVVKKILVMVVASTVAGFALVGCGSDKFVGKWTYYDTKAKVVGGTYTNKSILNSIKYDQDPSLTMDAFSIYPMREIAPAYYEVTITKNGDEYLVTDVEYRYSGTAEKTFEKTDQHFLYKDRTIVEEPVRYIIPSYVLTRKVYANKGIGIAKENELTVNGDSNQMEKYRYDAASKSLTVGKYIGNDRHTIYLKQDEKQTFEAYKTFMHKALQDIVDYENEGWQQLIDKKKPLTFHVYLEKDPSFDDSAYRLE